MILPAHGCSSLFLRVFVLAGINSLYLPLLGLAYLCLRLFFAGHVLSLHARARLFLPLLAIAHLFRALIGLCFPAYGFANFYLCLTPAFRRNMSLGLAGPDVLPVFACRCMPMLSVACPCRPCACCNLPCLRLQLHLLPASMSGFCFLYLHLHVLACLCLISASP